MSTASEPAAIADPCSDGAPSAATLYSSETTRVDRVEPAAASQAHIRKEYLGPHAERRRRNESAMLARLGGIEGVTQTMGEPQGTDVLALRDCGGTSLAQALREGPLPPGQVLALAPQLARILAAVHRAGVIHCDINPANIVVTKDDRAVLIDFDLAVAAEQQAANTHDGRILGTPAYLAPEQTGRTGRAVDHRADLYGLGVTLYEMATGRLPFEAEDPLQLMHEHLVREPVPPARLDARVPAGLSNIVLRLLAKAPEERYQSAEGLLHDLLRLRSEIEAGRDGLFELGRRDFAARLPPPLRLVGRDAELGLLRAAFESARQGKLRGLLVEGAAGAGKSTLIQELKPMAAAASGRFIYGKFDQYQRDSATGSAVIQALRALGRLLLAEHRDALAALRQAILDKLGRSAGLIAQLPEFGVLLGAHPALPAVDPAQAEERLRRATLDLLETVASPERPLVIVLDDLHWASARSLRAFEDVMDESALRGVLIVGAYRDLPPARGAGSGGNEAGAAHPLAEALKRWRAREAAPMEIAVGNLAPDALGELVAQMLRLPAAPAGELARAVGTLSAGNPFETVEMLNALRADGLLRLAESAFQDRQDPQGRPVLHGWTWDTAEIHRFVGRGTVGDLLAARIERLPLASQSVLACMSCIGGSVPRELAQVAAHLEEGALDEALRAPLEDGLLVAEGDTRDVLRFRHDRVQQAVLARMDAPARDRLQLAMARRLAQQSSFRQHMTQQYLGCAHLLTDPAERRTAARLFHSLAARLADVANFTLAETYLAAASTLLASLADPADEALRDSVEAARHAALYSLGRLDEADAVFAIVQERLTDPLALSESVCLQIRSFEWRARSAEGVELGLKLLARLGFAVPAAHTPADTAARLDALRQWIDEDHSLDLGARENLSDPRALAASRVHARLQRSAFVVNKHVATWLMRESARLWDEHGPCGALVLSLARMSALLVEAREEFRAGYLAARHVLAVGEARAFEPDIFEARIVFAIGSCHWFEPLEHAIDHVMRARDGLQGADALYVCYSYRATIPALLDCAPTLEHLDAELEASQALAERTANHHAVIVNLTEKALVASLRGDPQALGRLGDTDAAEEAWLARARRLPMAMFNHHLRKCLAFALRGDADALEKHSSAAAALVAAIPGYYSLAHVRLFRALALAWRLQRDDADVIGAQTLHDELEACRAWLARRAADQATNFGHLVRFVEAEQAWARREFWQAATLFEDAMGQAQHRRRPWHGALIAERAARFHLAQGLERSGRALLAQARDQFRAWGASAKSALLEVEHPWLRTAERISSRRASQHSSPVNTHVLDLMGVLRASQALSSETSLDSLAARVTEVLAALTGATRIAVLSCIEDQWWLLAPGAGAASMTVVEAARGGRLPLSVFAYAERTGEALVVEDALSDDRFARDPYFEGVALCSLLAAPISAQGAARAMLLLENRQVRSAFNAERLDAVMLIAGQLAVSLANAQLYESLEQRVLSRTHELEQTQARLVSTARRAGMAEIANNVLHNVGNVLNSVNISAGVVRRAINASKAEGLSRAVKLMHDPASDLGRFVESGTQGKALRSYLAELDTALRLERNNALADLDRLTSSIDHIKHVVATQQSHAGPSSVVEAARAEELLEQALHLCEEEIATCGLAVVRRFEHVPVAALDRQRVLQILVNLIRNAAQAMSGVSGRERELVLTTGLVRDGAAGGARLRMTVSDTGEGIAPENLTRIFSHGFTTRVTGHGFGLHSSALAAREMGGALTASSEGPARGATFTLEVPLGGA
ncbi:MAG TPA: AAA family ATPase [Ramlibacter sp.]|uniref:AAA family ATPase n=1 Tax=Ramlibacter sp. TaxID=1917967 RepID=UPI002C0B5920|nr:AAA family ATPase [Ramlibacter sp.]HVZ43166.1 AAA family ATPase [Ramlibacter sp.]